MSKSIEKLCRNTAYLLRDMFWKPREIRQDATLDRLRKYGLSPVSLNDTLDQLNIPPSVGRFPEILSEYTEMPDVIFSSMRKFEKSGHKQNNHSETQEALVTYLSEDVAKYLSTSPTAFRKIFDEMTILKKKRSIYII
ncbi:MAG TPA: hypothetical protein VJH92_04945 [Candidatus Nanoarchaeia archaeon]|nr:hypothetical protein [Candidatus Nanoarchaeia archaeon]